MKSSALFLLLFISACSFAQTMGNVVTRVDVFNKDHSIRGRGDIIVIAGPTYGIRFDGCGADKEVYLDSSLTRPVIPIPMTDSSLVPIFGKWDLRLFEYPRDFEHSKTEDKPLQINSDGTYSWYDVYKKPAIFSKWYPYPKLYNGVKGADAYNCVVIMDRYLQYYRCYVDNGGTLHVQKFCSDFIKDGQRIQ